MQVSFHLIWLTTLVCVNYKDTLLPNNVELELVTYNVNYKFQVFKTAYKSLT